VLNDEDRRTLLGLFGVSTLEVAEAMKSVLGAWHIDLQRAEAIEALLHRAQRLRGDSSTVELYATVELLRAFEVLLRAMRSGEVPPTPACSLLLEEVIDQIAEIAADALDGHGEPPDAHKDLIRRLLTQRLTTAS
jgi:chemotaxis protein histidine kinase CheA